MRLVKELRNQPERFTLITDRYYSTVGLANVLKEEYIDLCRIISKN